MEAIEKNLKPIDMSQIEELEKAISLSLNLTKFAKKTLIWMLRNSENLTRQVSLGFPPKHSKLGQEVSYGIHDAGGPINDLLEKIGSSMLFSSHGGHYIDDKFQAKAGGFAAWIAVKYYNDEAERLPLNIDEIKAIKL